MKRALLALVALCLAVACARVPVVRAPAPAARTDVYVLLASADGTTGALVITSGGQERTLDRPLAGAKVEQAGAIQYASVTEAEVAAIFALALAAQPPRPLSFTLYFLLGSDELTADSQRVVADIVSEVGRRPAPEVVVIGHTDTMGTHEYNDRLSLQRAERVRTRLLERGLGISAGNVYAVGRGKRDLLVPTADQVAEPRNRRVELVVR
jgi:outer membrane protein OmpA-like peptidoglycan-associated protein